jgi:hypothetical protein
VYELLVQQLIEPSSERRFIGQRTHCRYCSESGSTIFGKKTNAHTVPLALGNRTLFSLDECISCNSKFSNYEDALCKAVGPFLTLGGVRGRSGVRQTGRSGSHSTLRHTKAQEKRTLSVAFQGDPDKFVRVDKATGLLYMNFPVEGDMFVPLYAYKALTKIGLSILPYEELPRFQNLIESLKELSAAPHNGSLNVGFSYAYVGNALPAIAVNLLRRKDGQAKIPYMILLLQAGSVCCQVWLRSDSLDKNVDEGIRLGIRFDAQLPNPEGGYFPITYSEPLQMDWSGLNPTLQPFQAFELVFDPNTTDAWITPILKA